MVNERGTARSCELCLGWSVMYWSRVCVACKAWKKAYPARGRCPRCRHEAHLNTDGLCKPCLQAIRIEDDAEWALGLDDARPRDIQLLVGAYRDHTTKARPLVRGSSTGARVQQEWWRKLKQQREAAIEQPTVLEPGTRGQIPLFAMERRLTEATVSALVGRSVAGWQAARQAIAQMATEHGLSSGWMYKVSEMVRLALAVREAEGAERLPEAMLRDLLANGDAVRQILLWAGLLDEAPEPMRFSRARQPMRTPYLTAPAPLPPRLPRQCRDCHAWIPAGRRAGFVCDPCRHWRERPGRGRCCRCGRDGLAVRDGRCRGCHPYRLLDQAHPASMRATQLVFALPMGKGGPFEAFPVGDDETPDYVKQRPALHIGRGQEPLFTVRRDWTPVLARLRNMPSGEPPLSGPARRLVREFARHRPDERPEYRKNIRTLTILLYWLGAEAALFERDVYDLARIETNLAAKPVCQFLRACGLLVEDPELHRDADLAWIESALAALPEQVANEVGIWVKARREEGRREGEPRGYDGIRRYLMLLLPALTAWTTTADVTSLRQITPDHIDEAVEGMTGYARRGLATALRSLFRALKRERIIFRNPAHGLPVGDLKGLPKPIPSDLLMGLLDQARTPLGRLVVALAAIHALPGYEIRTLHTAGLDLSRGTLEVRRGLLRHTLYLEELTHQLAADWTNYRHQRWSASTNPHLLVSQKTAVDPDHPAVSLGTLSGALPRGLTLSGLRQDRILNEAAETADPLRLMRLFGITEQTAMRYVTAAHPERTAKMTR
ncbi:hypothetical protein ABT390_33775 [Streptomyces aurantiacus]|uniref:Core-binding (CB) domain-containing protein n=1 Tax=Streptomyces aurantiacus JA 4570 TaxID=1286094 RepID=S3ZUP2_9ACTN|nr:hypothetical protein [Streptomyces aurantiacus]EPH46913.1 hypothetical protein STRAU_0079 [Streptomyces aurantiacus JA 4570]